MVMIVSIKIRKFSKELFLQNEYITNITVVPTSNLLLIQSFSHTILAPALFHTVLPILSPDGLE